jgi:preprotein translocase subunit SecD
MKQRPILLIIVIVLFVIWVDLPIDHRFGPNKEEKQDITTHLGLDLVGGVQAMLEVDLDESVEISSDSMNTARAIIEKRANGLLGVGEAIVQQAGDRRLVVELPGETDPDAALTVLGEIGQLEFVDMGNSTDAPALIGTVIQTDYLLAGQEQEGSTAEGPVYHTVMTGEALQSVVVERNQVGQYSISFQLNSEFTKVFGDYTSNNINSFLAIVLDKTIISMPRVESAITSGNGSITGQYTAEEINDLAIKLRYGSLPIPLKVVQSRTIGPSLGQDSLQKSLVAGLIGFGLIILFMIGYYRLPGLLSALALCIYVATTYALFRLIPVTLTLPGIAGFILSIGVAVDANILIFERLKEELKAGKRLNVAIDLGWDRAWPSIRDSNFSTLITCAILFWFGSAFGASIVKGFAVTLALGVGVSLFTAIMVTRTFLHLWLDNFKVENHERWFGI